MTIGQTTEFQETRDFIRAHVHGEFLPVAYYDEVLDCVRVITRDCSVCEQRVDEYLTIAEDNYPSSPAEKYVGFTIKGVRQFLRARMAANQESRSNFVDVAEVLEFVTSGQLPRVMEGPEAKQLVDFAVAIAFNLLKEVPVSDRHVVLKSAA